jgi:hypothetical protein
MKIITLSNYKNVLKNEIKILKSLATTDFPKPAG